MRRQGRKWQRARIDADMPDRGWTILGLTQGLGLISRATAQRNNQGSSEPASAAPAPER